MSRRKEPRAKPATEVPLDDGPRDGTEPWRVIDGVAFCHWDRWLLRLALTEPRGLDTIAREFRTRAARGHDSAAATAEAMLAQVVDLKARLDRVGRAPASVLDDEEKASEWLRKKAFKRVWQSAPQRKTEAMRRTPRAVAAERALRGNWSALAVSPAPYADNLSAVVGDGYYDYRGTGIVVTLLESAILQALLHAGSDAERVAIQRAVLTVLIGAMDSVDDSYDEVGELFREHERSYLDLIRGSAGDRWVMRDLLELVIWEDYGLFVGIEKFLAALPEPHADVAVRVLAPIIAELRRERLTYPLGKALRLRRALLAAADEAEGESIPSEDEIE